VMLAPGRAAKPSSTGSAAMVKTMGTAVLAALAASAAGPDPHNALVSRLGSEFSAFGLG
jgi:hypothetical protein